VNWRPQQGRTPHFALMALFIVALAVQIYLAGRGVFHTSPNYNAHKDLGGILHIGSLLILIVTIAFPSTRNRTDIGLAVLLFVLTTVQAAIGSFKHPDVAAFHPLNAVVIVFLSYAMIHRDTGAPAATSAVP
jgi:hypothetical protein